MNHRTITAAICAAQTLELMRRANEVLGGLRFARVPPHHSIGWRAGYARALVDVRAWPEVEALRAAVQDLRPYLAATTLRVRGQ